MTAQNPIIVALDVDSPSSALALADRLRGVVGAVKVGSQLFTAAGPEIIRRLTERGHRVFLDLKYHDIPNTVAAAAAEAARLGAWMIDVHASGGLAMMKAAGEAARASAAAAGVTPPLIIAITVLTSFDQNTIASVGIQRSILDQVDALAWLAQEAGLDGVVASPHEVARLRADRGDQFVLVTPGIRAHDPDDAGRKRDDQARTMTAGAAMAAGASFIVVGRPIIAAPDPLAAAKALAEEAGVTLPR
ncbi:MAG: orotidine-5'-phosphate decarboxylase [Acidobacteria bacterium]|nr:orotidine-5'-phosphate decarboxylase [Acidobacteriota bacterium]